LNRYFDSPKKKLDWFQVDDYLLSTVLGEDICTVWVAMVGGHRVLKEGEDDRIRRKQINIFCEWLPHEKEEFSPDQLRYILIVLEDSQETLNRMFKLQPATIQSFLSSRENLKPWVHEMLAGHFYRKTKDHPQTLGYAQPIAPAPELQEPEAIVY